MAETWKDGVDTVLRALRRRADEDFVTPPAEHVAHRHQVDLPDLGLRVSLTRSLYPNRPDGDDEYAVTISRLALDRAPEDTTTELVLSAAFGSNAIRAAQERTGGALVRMFRVPAAAAN